MQPYFLPYLSYYKLLKLVDKFVIYDDVNFINRGWINRNNILVGGKAHLFTVPLIDASQNKLIYEVQVSPDQVWRKKILKTISQAYRKAPQFETVFPLVEDIITDQSESVADFCLQSLVKTARFMNIDTEIVKTSRQYNNSDLKGQHRILSICQKEGASHYINPIRGQALYDKHLFCNEGITLNFIHTTPRAYPQFKNDFVPLLSILDIMMFNNQKEIQDLLGEYDLI
ncbi:hypothetical protein GCM10007390_32080 [Persicitalea jodogahamensis]|uniref:WbqC-like protein n=2 Tax=Persicitalea jodogahamensis TaxID=402147 RepID=A0A8J3G9U1_9BACT|nr:WbqC family protein [Persicitalea jodogahamensis]GHB75828.1 hypothetical protein GCM10007390_32080 [Persicitalea jodogahamensis]